MPIDSIYDRVSNAATQKALSKVRIPSKLQEQTNVAKALFRGDIDGAIGAGLDNLFLKLGISGTRGAKFGALTEPTRMLGGLTMKKVKELFERSSATTYAKKNLWLLRISNLKGGIEDADLNLFAVDLSYAPITITGDAVHVGSGSFDLVTNSERVEMRLTTFDDVTGSIKQWFYERHQAMCKRDGTHGLPVDYLFRVTVTHAICDDEVAGAEDAHSDTYIMRVGSLEYDLSRRDDGLTELQMSFVQFDTFTGLR